MSGSKLCPQKDPYALYWRYGNTPGVFALIFSSEFPDRNNLKESNGIDLQLSCTVQLKKEFCFVTFDFMLTLIVDAGDCFCFNDVFQF